MMWLAGLALVVSALMAFPGPGLGLKRLVPRAASGRHRWTRWWPGVVGVACGVAGVFAGPVAVVAAFGMVAATTAWVVMARMRDKRATGRASEVVQAASALESLMGLGHVPSSALMIAAVECPVLEPVAAAVRMGGPPWQVMADMANVPGQGGLARIGRAWQVATESGASMRDALERVRISLEEAADTAATVNGELAGPRATGRILAVLPLVGLGMAYGIGADPLRFLTSGIAGRGCLLAGIGLACAGVVWSEHMAREATGSPLASPDKRLTGKGKGGTT